MINMPLPEIIKKIKEKSSLTDEQIKKKLKEKMDQLSGLISEEGAAHIIANELGIQLVKLEGKLKVKDVLPGMRNVEVNGKVVRKYELREFDTGQRQGKVANFLLGDETGVIRIVMWNSQTDSFPKLNEGDIVNIKSGYVRENNGRKEVHLNDNSKLVINPAGVKVEDVKTAGPSGERKKLSELAETDSHVEVLATIVQLFDPRFFEVCPECGSRVKPEREVFVCKTHGKVKPAYAYVLNAFLDDGSDSVRSVFWRQQAQQLLNMQDAQIQEFRVKPESFEPLKTELLGHIVKINGRVNKNAAFERLELIADQVSINPDPDQEIERLKKEAAAAAEKAEPSEEAKEEAEKIAQEAELEEKPAEMPDKVKIEERKEAVQDRVEVSEEPDASENEVAEAEEPDDSVPKKEPVEKSVGDGPENDVVLPKKELQEKRPAPNEEPKKESPAPVEDDAEKDEQPKESDDEELISIDELEEMDDDK